MISDRLKSDSNHSVWKRYLCASLTPGLVAGILQMTWPFLEPAALALFLAAIIFSGWYGGSGAAVLSLLVSFFLADCFFVEPHFAFPVHDYLDTIRIGLFLAVGVTSVVLSELMRAERRRARTHLEATRRAQKERQRSEANYQPLFEANPIPAWAYDIETLAFLAVNEAAIKQYGYTRDEFLAMTTADIRPLEDVPALRAVQAASANGGEFMKSDWRHRRKDGSIVDVEITQNLLEFAGKPARLVLANDVTERKQVSAARREAEEKYWDIFENAVEGIFQSTPDGHFITANPAMARILGYDSAVELLRCRTDIARQHYVEPALRAEFQRLLKEHGVVRKFEHEAYRKDGSKIWLSENVRSVCDRSGKVLYYEGFTEDITARKRAQESLNLLRNLIDNSNDAIEVLEPVTMRFLDCNTSAHRGLGYTREEFLSLSAYDIDSMIDPQMAGRLNEEIDNSSSVTFESMHRRKDGSRFPVEINVKNIRLEQDYRLAVVRDVTERKQAEAALRQSEARYRELFENAKDATYVHDLSGKYISVNRAAEKLCGRAREEIIGKKFGDFVAPEQIDLVREHLCHKLVEEGETIYEVDVIARDGSRVPVEVSSHVIYRDGVAVAVQGTARDITERKRAEHRLRQEKEFSENLIRTANVIILGLDLEGNINIFNQTAEEITGYSTAELKGRSWFETLVPQDRYSGLWDEFKRLIATGMPKTFENFILTKDGQEREIMWQNNRITVDDKVVGTISFGIDITEQKRAEEALRKSEDRFSKAFHSSPASLSIALLEDGRLLEVNDTFLRMTGFNRDEVIGRTTVELGLWAGNFRQTMAVALQERGAVTNLEFKFQKKSNEIRDGVLSTELIHLDAGPSVLGIAQDITERNRAQERLREYEEVVEGLAEMIVVVDRDFRFLLANRAYLKYRGKQRNQVLGHQLGEIVGEELFGGVLKENLERAFHGQLMSYELKVTYPKLGERDLSVSYFPIDGPSGIDRVACVLHDITERKRDEQALRNYSVQLIKAQETERQHIARELHDQIGQVLTAVHLNLQSVWETCESAESRALIDEGVAIVDEALVQVRDLSLELRPALLDDLGLMTALRWYADRFAQRTGILATAVIDLPETPMHFNREIETACFRIVQEALTNVVRHARAKRVLISLKNSHNRIQLVVKDNGIGFDVHAQSLAPVATQVGIRGMKERTLAVGGQLEIRSSPSRGTEIRARFPFEGAIATD